MHEVFERTRAYDEVIPGEGEDLSGRDYDPDRGGVGRNAAVDPV